MQGYGDCKGLLKEVSQNAMFLKKYYFRHLKSYTAVWRDAAVLLREKV